MKPPRETEAERVQSMGGIFGLGYLKLNPRLPGLPFAEQDVLEQVAETTRKAVPHLQRIIASLQELETRMDQVRNLENNMIFFRAPGPISQTEAWGSHVKDAQSIKDHIHKHLETTRQALADMERELIEIDAEQRARLMARAPRRLDEVVIKGKTYFRDERLREYRNVDNPHDRIPFGQEP